jgi:hypothetical protein
LDISLKFLTLKLLLVIVDLLRKVHQQTIEMHGLKKKEPVTEALPGAPAVVRKRSCKPCLITVLAMVMALGLPTNLFTLHTAEQALPCAEYGTVGLTYPLVVNPDSDHCTANLSAQMALGHVVDLERAQESYYGQVRLFGPSQYGLYITPQSEHEQWIITVIVETSKVVEYINTNREAWIQFAVEFIPLITTFVGIWHFVLLTIVSVLVSTFHSRFRDPFTGFILEWVRIYDAKTGSGYPTLQIVMLFAFYIAVAAKIPVWFYQILGIWRRVPVNPIVKTIKLKLNESGGMYAAETVECALPFTSYPWPRLRFPTEDNWSILGIEWTPLCVITKDVVFNVCPSDIQSRLVACNPLLTPTNTQTPTGSLEMAVPNSKREVCAQPPSMGILHCSKSGSADLSRYPFAAIGRVKAGTETYLVTATHVVQNIMLHARDGRLVYIRYKGNDHLVDIGKLNIHLCSPVEHLDVMIIEVPFGFWCQIPLKTAKLAKALRPTDVVKVYTPTATGQWTNALGSVKGHASTLFQFLHSASTDFGASGGLVLTTGGTCLGVHLRRDPVKGLNVAVALKYILLSPKTQESCTDGDYDMFDERENDRDYDKAEEKSDAGDDDWNNFDEDDDYQRSVYIGGKAGHRSYTAISRSAYTQAQRDADFAKEDLLIERGIMRIGSWADASDDDLSFLQGKAFESGGLVTDTSVEKTSVPSALVSATTSLLVSPPQNGATSPSSTVNGTDMSTVKVDAPSPPNPTPVSSPTSLESTTGSVQEKKTPTLSSAPPGVDSPLAGGKKRNSRQRKKKQKSLVSATGTSPTSHLAPPTSVSATKQVTESKEPNPTPKSSKKSPKGSSANTQKPKNPTVSERMLIVNAMQKSYADALRGL